MFGRITMVLACLVAFLSMTAVAEEEIVFEPVSSGNFAVMHLNEEDVFIINTGSLSSRNEVINYLDDLNDKNIKGILITNVNQQNCGNLSFILNEFEVDNVYIPKNNKETCEIHQDYQDQTYILSKNERIAISSKYYIDHIYDPDDRNSHVAISNGTFVCYWYEGKINHDLWDQHTQVIFLPDNPTARLTEKDLVKLDPEVAIINQRGEIRSLIELFQKQWVDIYALRKGVSAHITILHDDYDLYLKRE